VTNPAAAALKTGWKLLVRDLGGVDAVAAATRATRSLASEYGNVHSERFVPVDVVLEAEVIGGSPHVTAALARAQGFELLPVVVRLDGTLAKELARIGRDIGDLFTRAANALGGGEISEADRAGMVRDLDDLRRTAAEALMLLAPNSPSLSRKAK
jgi:hypothetical protein